jgi:7-carboxy-7-deazaguanine synthase
MNPTKLPVNEVFETVQGEATFTGTPSVFIRLQGCPVGCSWCDTKHTWEMTGKVIPIKSMIDKTDDTDCYSLLSITDILEMLKEYRANHIVITGGEPAMYDLTDLTTALIANGYSVQLETSGTFEIKVHGGTWITVSPKVDMAGGYKVLESCLILADEIKYPVGKLRDIDTLKGILEKIPCDSIWLQPLSKSEKATKLCVEQATINNWKISIQTHKFIGVR